MANLKEIGEAVSEDCAGPPVLVDDRTEAEKKTHRLAVVGTDTFMSGWGRAGGGASYAAWAVRDGDLAGCLSWVESREDMIRVRVVSLDGYRPKAAHTHIYVYNQQALKKW